MTEESDKMPKYLVTEEEVKKALDIDSFRNMSKSKIMDFISLIPNMDKDIALAAINQFPAYVDMTGNMVKELIGLCDSALKETGASHKESIEAYKLILNTIKDDLERDNITPEEKKDDYEKMIQVADKIANKDKEFKEYMKDVLKYGVTFMGGTLIIGACILGINVKGVNKLPTLKKN